MGLSAAETAALAPLPVSHPDRPDRETRAVFASLAALAESDPQYPRGFSW